MTTHSLTVRAPAKINLFLHILGQKPNAYHELQTLFQFIDLYDYVDIKVREDGQISFTSNDKTIPEEQQLVIKAAHRLKEVCQCKLGAHIHLHKHIPMAAGLGGGSSDAASTLLALNQLWNCRLTRPALQALGVELGADVPVFIYGHSAFASGIGEQLQRAMPKEYGYVIAKPEVHISTQALFQHPQLPRHTPAIAFSTYTYESTRNDCESLVRRLYPPVEQVFAYLSHFGKPRLTGTGSSVFLPLDDTEKWPTIQSAAPCPIWLCRGLNDSPAWLDLANNDH